MACQSVIPAGELLTNYALK